MTHADSQERRATRKLSADEARTEVLRLIGELEPEVNRLKAESRRLTRAARDSKMAYWTADRKLRSYRRYLFALANAVAEGTVT